MKTEIIEFHEAEIYCPVEEGKIYVAIKPICEALGIDSDAQNRRIKRDEILSQLRSQVTAVGREIKAEKERFKKIALEPATEMDLFIENGEDR